MSSGGQVSKTKQEVLEEYEKDYLARLEILSESKASRLVEQMKKESEELEKKDYIGFCAFCKMGVARDEMAYKNNNLFHSNCFEQQGSNFPLVNQELLNQSSRAKAELVILKNLKARTIDALNPDNPKSRSKPKKKSKGKTKKRRPKRRTVTKKKKSKRRTSKRKPSKKRRTATKRRKTAKRRKASRRKARRRPARRAKRPSRRKTRRPARRKASRKKRTRRRR